MSVITYNVQREQKIHDVQELRRSSASSIHTFYLWKGQCTICTNRFGLFFPGKSRSQNFCWTKLLDPKLCLQGVAWFVQPQSLGVSFSGIGAAPRAQKICPVCRLASLARLHWLYVVVLSAFRNPCLSLKQHGWYFLNLTDLLIWDV